MREDPELDNFSCVLLCYNPSGGLKPCLGLDLIDPRSSYCLFMEALFIFIIHLLTSYFSEVFYFYSYVTTLFLLLGLITLLFIVRTMPNISFLGMIFYDGSLVGQIQRFRVGNHVFILGWCNHFSASRYQKTILHSFLTIK